MLVEFTSKKYVEEVSKVELELSILDKVTFLHFHYSGGYDYYVKFVPDSYQIDDRKYYKLDFIYMNDTKVVKSDIRIDPTDRFPPLVYLQSKQEFDYVGQKNSLLPHDYFTIIANYWLLQKRLDDCFFNVITEEEFNLAKEKFFSI